uniref:Uncharacterized protein n=1 Tax=Knipowitschia caucasica TaxID=637954 RepID=A0AAV2LNB2_KNICA
MEDRHQFPEQTQVRYGGQTSVSRADSAQIQSSLDIQDQGQHSGPDQNKTLLEQQCRIGVLLMGSLCSYT